MPSKSKNSPGTPQRAIDRRLIVLNIKQELFAKAYVQLKGKGLAAHHIAYPGTKMSDRSRSTEAIRLLKNPLICEKIDEYKQDLQVSMGLEPKHRLGFLQTALDGATADNQFGAARGLVNEMNKMLAGHTTRRKMNLKLHTVDNPVDKMRLLEDALTKGDISVEEYTAISNSLQLAAKLERSDERISELAAKLDKMEAMSK